MGELRSKCCGAEVTSQRIVIFGEAKDFYKCNECHFPLKPTEVEKIVAGDCFLCPYLMRTEKHG